MRLKVKNNKKKLKAPKLRFPEFTDDWEKCELGEILKTHSFRKYLSIPQTYGDIEIIQQGDKPILGYSDGKPFTEYADIILFGDHTVSLYKPTKPFFIATDGVKILSADGFDGQYLFATLERYKPESQGYKRHFTILKNKGIWFTKNKNEQFKIGSFFKEIDQLITLNQNKISHIKDLKAGLLQKMFPKNGETKPEIRFDGFTGDWKECKLGDVVDIFDGTHQTPEYTNSGVKFVSVENIRNLETKKYISQKAYQKEYSNKQAEKGDVLMTRIGDIGTAKIIESTEPLAYYVTLALLKPKKVNSNFLAWLIGSSEIQKNIWKRTLHIAFPKKINLGEINKIELTIPNISEQKKIGKFFSQLDNLLTLYQCKLEHLQEQKKSLLKQMFI